MKKKKKFEEFLCSFCVIKSLDPGLHWAKMLDRIRIETNSDQQHCPNFFYLELSFTEVNHKKALASTTKLVDTMVRVPLCLTDSNVADGHHKNLSEVLDDHSLNVKKGLYLQNSRHFLTNYLFCELLFMERAPYFTTKLFSR